MSLRIAFDLDGVLADMDREVTRHAHALFSQPSALPADTVDEPADDDEPPVPSPPRLTLNARQRKALWRHIRSLENFWETLEEMEAGAIRRLATLASDRRWEIIFLTSRPATAGETTQIQTQRWLELKGFARPSVFVVTGSRGLVAASLGLDFVIDDRMENCMDVVADSKARAILVWREDAQQLPAAATRLGIGVIESTAACLEMLAAIETGAPDKPRAIDRVKRLLGFKEPALD
jgi:hypothetical protein